MSKFKIIRKKGSLFLDYACERHPERLPGGPPCDARAPRLHHGPGQSFLLSNLHCGIFRQYFRHDHRVRFQAHAEQDELFLRQSLRDGHAYFTGVHAFSNGRPLSQGGLVLRRVHV